MQKEKRRLDDLIFELGHADSLIKARSIILSGSVLVNDIVVSKIGTMVTIHDQIRIKPRIKNHVSRGALKLLGVFAKYPKLEISNKICLDLGASTGGFTQILLEKGAKQVYAIDVGYGQLSQKIANDPRVVVLDRFHIRDLVHFDFEKKLIDICITMDLSFISILSAFRTIIPFLYSQESLRHCLGITLVKPQFEVDPNQLDKGIVLPNYPIGGLLRKLWREIRKIEPTLERVGVLESPIKGAEGNREFFLVWKFRK